MDISKASYKNEYDYSTQTTNATGVFFKPDGKEMYILSNISGGIADDKIYQYTLTNPRDLTSSNVSYTGVSPVVTQDLNMHSMSMSEDGTKVYILEAGRILRQYSLSTAWDITTLSYASKYLSVFSQTGSSGVTLAVYIKRDGTKVYIFDTNSNKIFQYSLSTAWDLSTASYDSKSLDISAQAGDCQGIALSNAGDVLLAQSGDNVYQYSLSTAFDISTASYDSLYLDVSSQESGPRDIFMSNDDKYIFLPTNTNDILLQYSTLSSKFVPQIIMM